MEGLDEKTSSSEGIHQTLLLQGPVKLRRGWRRKKQHLFLFNDKLVVAKNPHKKSFKIKHIIPLSDLWIDDYLHLVGEDYSGADKSILLLWPMENFVATFRSSEEKEEWWSLLQRGINEATKKGKMKTTTLKIFIEDTVSRAGPLYVTATNLDTVSDIMKKLIPMVERPNAEEDHQLWFSPGHGEASFPLTGEEHPYYIKRNNLLKAACRPRGPRNYRVFQTLPRLEIEHLFRDIQGWFILKLTETARARPGNNEEERPFQRRRSLKNRVFQRTSTNSRTHMFRTPPNPKTGKLFGNALTNMCEDDNLPTAILDMISFINEKGPSTEGIFRVPGNAKSCRALREKLDSGKEVNWSNESILVVASVFKEFLQNIPGSVLTASLYEKWLPDIAEVNEEEKVPAVQSLLEQMPKANADLLRHLVGVLYNIERQSAINRMTAYNLSVCIAPSILCLPSSCNSGLLHDISKKISLVQFLIENCLEIFGENCMSFVKKSSVSTDNIEEASGSLNPVIDAGEMKTAEHHDSSCPTERSCPTDNDAVPLSPAAPLHIGGLTELEKPVKRPYCKLGSSTCWNSVCSTPPTSNTRRIFGRSLMDICEDGNLPTKTLVPKIRAPSCCPAGRGTFFWLQIIHSSKSTILIKAPEFGLCYFNPDMISVINKIGTDVEGIFRVPISLLRPVRALTEKLDSGEEVNFKSESPLLVASILKNFIRNIQGSLLSPSLYDEWLGVTDEENEEQTISVIQSHLQQLPKPNVDLLRLVFAMLHNDESHSSTNRMTAYNLSVCIDPSILSLPSSRNWGVEQEVSRKISLVQHLIENCSNIVEENITTTLSGDSSKCNNKENPLDSINNYNEYADLKAARGVGSVCPTESSCAGGNNAEPCRPSSPLPQEMLTGEGRQDAFSPDFRKFRISSPHHLDTSYCDNVRTVSTHSGKGNCDVLNILLITFVIIFTLILSIVLC